MENGTCYLHYVSKGQHCSWFQQCRGHGTWAPALMLGRCWSQLKNGATHSHRKSILKDRWWLSMDPWCSSTHPWIQSHVGCFWTPHGNQSVQVIWCLFLDYFLNLLLTLLELPCLCSLTGSPPIHHGHWIFLPPPRNSTRTANAI